MWKHKRIYGIDIFVIHVNAKELALDKLNAANMLGMYIYGISIGMNFKDISKIIASRTGIIIDSYIKEDSIL